ncbi:hypothetical protein ACM66B_003048 [Microbotryomycetes sp. NB124-2]
MSTTQTVLKTGLGERLISDDVEGKAFDKLPIIDLTKITSNDVKDRKEVAAEVQAACIESGFFYIKNHGIEQAVLDEAFNQARQFFDQPLDKKMLVDLHKGTSFKGYAPLMGEKVDPASRGDVHESWDMGADDQKFSEDKENSGNMWPPADDLPGFRPALQRTWDEIMALGKRLFPIFALALDLPEDYFDKHITNPGSVMRILNYPPQYGPTDLAEIGIGAHTDYEMFTLLVQHGDVQALQVLNGVGDWVQAPPIPGTIVLNLGDQLQRWTNGVFKSTVHRAINRTGQARMSMPFFFGVNYDTLIEPLPNTVTESRPAKYQPVLAGKYVEQRIAETYIKVDPKEATA